jgi:hypothetical protein
MLNLFPSMVSFLEETENGRKSIGVLQDMLMDRNRLMQCRSLLVLFRLSGVIDADLPTSGKTGDDRVTVLKRMDDWTWVWWRKEYDTMEDDLVRMRENGSKDVALWESFSDYLKSLERPDIFGDNEEYGEIVEAESRGEPRVMSDSELKKQFRCDTWPPRWFENDKTIMDHWRGSISGFFGGWNYKALDTIRSVILSSRCVPSCLCDILRDIRERRPFEKDSEYDWLLSLFLYDLSSGQFGGFEECPGLPEICLDLLFSLILLRIGQILWIEGGLILNVTAIWRMLITWDDLCELLDGDQRAWAVWEMLRKTAMRGGRKLKAWTLLVLYRTNLAVSGPAWPVYGWRRDQRQSILKEMDAWVWAGYRKRWDFHKAKLDKMKREGEMSMGDISLWESFYSYLYGVLNW